MSAAEAAAYLELERWFARHLREPDRFARSRRPHACHRAISWFEDGAIEHIRRMRELVATLRAHGIQVHELGTRPRLHRLRGRIPGGCGAVRRQRRVIRVLAGGTASVTMLLHGSGSLLLHRWLLTF